MFPAFASVLLDLDRARTHLSAFFAIYLISFPPKSMEMIREQISAKAALNEMNWKSPHQVFGNSALDIRIDDRASVFERIKCFT